APASANPFTVKLGDATAPGRPPFAAQDEVTIDDGIDPYDEPLAPSGETLSFGSNVPPAPPAARPVDSGTLGFAGQKAAQGPSTMGWGSGPPAVADPRGSGTGTLVFSPAGAAPPPSSEPKSSGTLVFTAPSAPGAPPPSMAPLSSGTLMFTPAKGLPAASPE